MMHILLSRWRQGHRTLPYPKEVPSLPERFRGLPRIQAESVRRAVAPAPTPAPPRPSDSIRGAPT